MEHEAGDIRPAPFPSPRTSLRGSEGVEVRDTLEQVTASSHRAACCLRHPPSIAPTALTRRDACS